MGQLRAHDGSALRTGEVTLRRIGFETPVETAVLDAEGRFLVEVPCAVYAIEIAAVDHVTARRETLVTDDLTVDGALGTSEPAGPGASPAIPASLTWYGEDDTTKDIRGFLDRWSAHLEAARGETPTQIPSLRGLASAASTQVDATQDTHTRVLLRAAHMRLFYGLVDDPAMYEHELTTIVRHLSADDPYLALVVGFEQAVLRDLRETEGELAERAVAWFEQALTNREPAIAIVALGALLELAERAGDEERMRGLYQMTSEPRYAGNYYLELVRQRYDPERPPPSSR